MIDYIRKYKQFTSSHHFYEGIRMTIAVMVPVLVAAYYGRLAIGVTVAIGAMCVGITDNPGPIHHRRNGMLITLVLLFVTILLTGIAAPYSWLSVILLLFLPFVFSIIGIYGSRATSAGMACMLVMVLNIDKTLTTAAILQNAMLTLLGGTWYFILSQVMYQLRPYKLVQQVVGDCLQETANYLRIKAIFYSKNNDYDKAYQALAEAQVLVHQKQDMAREHLFKTRSIVRESTHTGRVLVMAFIDTLDLFERIMTSQQDYRVLHEAFDNTGLLPAFGNTILQLADDLQHVGIAFQEGKGLNADENSSGSVKALGDFFLEQRKALLTPQNSDAFIGLHQVLNSLKDVQHRIDTLHAYSSYDLAFRGSGRTEKELKRFVARSDYNPKLVVDNLNMHSNIFRHSLRVSLALVLGYLGAFWLPVGHDYWIMLTIIVILKPAYSLTRKRNIERLAGTVGGVIVAAFLLYTIHENAVLLSILMLSMIITYSLIRTRYLPSVVFMTIYIVIAFHLLKSGDTKSVLRDRLVDTAIGSAIAFATVFLLPPRWEHETILDLASDLVEANRNYFNYIAGAFSGETFLNNPYRLKRKATYVALANLGDAFQRMLNEPKSKQQKGEQLHQLIVSSHVLVSHIATLSAYRQQYGTDYGLPAFARVQETADLQFRAASDTLKLGQKAAGEETVNPEQVMEPVEWQASEAAQTKGLKPAVFKTIVDQFEIILRVSNDIKNIASALVS